MRGPAAASAYAMQSPHAQCCHMRRSRALAARQPRVPCRRLCAAASLCVDHRVFCHDVHALLLSGLQVASPSCALSDDANDALHDSHVRPRRRRSDNPDRNNPQGGDDSHRGVFLLRLSHAHIAPPPFALLLRRLHCTLALRPQSSSCTTASTPTGTDRSSSES